MKKFSLKNKSFDFNYISDNGQNQPKQIDSLKGTIIWVGIIVKFFWILTNTSTEPVFLIGNWIILHY